MKNILNTIILCIVFFTYSHHAFSGSFVSLKTRTDVEQPFWLIEADNAVASVILFAGGKGRIDIDSFGINKTGNFLVRSRNNFVEHDLNVAVVDVPTDRKKLYYFRTTEEHAQDIAAVIRHLREKYKKPVWLIGTSRGTTSVANVASRLNEKDGPDGIVLTATISEGGSKGESVNDVSLSSIKQSVLFVHNELDECHVCPPEVIELLADKLSNAKLNEIKMFSGGYTEGRACGAKSYHGFLGIETKVIAYIATWLKQQVVK